MFSLLFTFLSKKLALYVCLIVVLASIKSYATAQTHRYEVLIGIDYSPPYHWIDSKGEAQGTMVTFMSKLVNNSGGVAKFVSCPWARCLKLAEIGQVDMLFGVSKTLEREEFLHFVEPELINSTVQFVFYQLTSARPISSYYQLYRLKVGVLRGARYFTEFDSDPKLIKIEFTDLSSAVVSLQKGRIDALIQPADVVLPIGADSAPLTRSNYRYTVSGKGYVVLSKKFAYPEYLTKLSNEMATMFEMNNFIQVVNDKDH